jgi:peptide/nickel transport system ATP-binding protein/oligopeptide transport system ATP-binding protein
LDKDKVLLEVRNLVACIETGSGLVKAVDDVSFDVRKGEIVGLVGESGCGKTMTALSIMRLLPEPFGRIVGGSIYFEGQDLTKLTEEEMRAIRGNKISIIFQDPLTALNPIMKIGEQIVEAIVSHRKVDKNEAKRRAIELLHSVGIPDGEVIASQYPFRVSGGMRQRVMIAVALACDPVLLIADEPTTNLDVSIQAQILELINEIRRKRGTSVLLITHNLGLVAWLCDRVFVMYAGKIVEHAPTEALFANPYHPYTQLLLKSVPKLDSPRDKLTTVEGEVPNLIKPPSGCRFHPRCPYVKEFCRTVEPALIKVNTDHYTRCLMQDSRYSGEWK